MTKRKKKTLVLGLILLFIVMAALAVLLPDIDSGVELRTIDTKGYSIAGIDVSAHNGKVDFTKVKSAGVDFVFIKATEGKTFRDSSFEKNLAAANRAGLKTGAYHFFRFDVDGKEQARNFMQAVAGKDIQLPLVIDVEEHGNPYGFRSKVQRQLRDMVDELTIYGFPTAIYTNKKGYSNFVGERFAECNLWICTFSQPDSTLTWDYWQFTHKGAVPGIESDVDMDVWHGDSKSWLRHCEETERQLRIANERYSTINEASSR